MADRWDETTPDPSRGTPGGIQQYPNFDTDWNSDSIFNPGVDRYAPATSTSPGTGYRLYDANGHFCCDYGLLMQLKGDQTYTAMWYQEVDLGNCGNSSSCYRDTIEGCYGATLGDTVGVKPGVSHGPTDQGTSNLIGQDPDAFWFYPGAPPATEPWLATLNPNGTPVPSDLADRCPSGCVYSPTYGVNAGPRVRAIPIIDPNQLVSPPNGNVTIMNILGFFVTDVQGNGNNQVVRGRVITIPGSFDSQGPSVSPDGSFLQTIILVR